MLSSSVRGTDVELEYWFLSAEGPTVRQPRALASFGATVGRNGDPRLSYSRFSSSTAAQRKSS
jgi:hypothetical protein